ncbi:hypothetical protein MAR_006200 [Mya arenaria]|uniref:Uncharacterized protein n=1 Tax=Mya arenaria TaxID=6604 RepID=A0ABY7D8N5_MYAAR|nr:hypothetical protein MAR_006200 [Mya arenaria]
MELQIVLLATISLMKAKEETRFIDSSDFERLMLKLQIRTCGGEGHPALQTTSSSIKVYGAEYEFDFHHDGVSKLFGQNLNDEDAPCAVFKSPRATSVKIPKECFSGWTKEYKCLIAGDYQHASASEFICLDERPEMVVGGAVNINGKVFFLAEAVCGSLPCPPYVQGRELTCVMCSK